MPDAPAELPALLDGVRRRDEAASRLLVERLYPLVLKLVRAHRPQQMAEEDLCQEVFMSVFASLEQYRGAVPFEHSVSRVAVNTCIDQLRRQRVRPEIRWADMSEEEAESLQAMVADQSEPSPDQGRDRGLGFAGFSEHERIPVVCLTAVPARMPSHCRPGFDSHFGRNDADSLV